MNLYGSSRKLIEHSKQAVIAAIEIYNKPNFVHREAILALLLVNAWELALLALLSKNRIRIFERKERGRDYRTLSLDDSLHLAKPLLPDAASNPATLENIKLLRSYRNSATHYYHDDHAKHAIYALAQAAVKNYRDFALACFSIDMSNEVNLVLLPLTFNEPPDFVEYFKSEGNRRSSSFTSQLFSTMETLDSEGAEISRLVTSCHIKLESTKDINYADIVAAKSGDSQAGVLIKPVNPDDSHPFYQKDIIGTRDLPKHPKLNRTITSNTFQAITWKHGVKADREKCWASRKGGSPRYSQQMIHFLNSLSDEEISSTKAEYNSRAKK
jgi:hypothetical protein